MFQHVPPRIYLVWDCLYFMNLHDHFLSLVREGFDGDLFRYLLTPFIFFFVFWDSCSLNVGAFNVVSEFSNTVFIYFPSFFFILFYSRDFHHSVFQVTCPFFCLSYSAIDSFRAFFILVIVLFISRSLLNFSLIFSIHSSILFLRSWIIFTIITLNSFSARLSIFCSFSYPFRSLSCSFICSMVTDRA